MFSRWCWCVMSCTVSWVIMGQNTIFFYIVNMRPAWLPQQANFCGIACKLARKKNHLLNNPYIGIYSKFCPVGSCWQMGFPQKLLSLLMYCTVHGTLRSSLAQTAALLTSMLIKFNSWPIFSDFLQWNQNQQFLLKLLKIILTWYLGGKYCINSVLSASDANFASSPGR